MSNQRSIQWRQPGAPGPATPLALRATRGGFKLLSGLAPGMAARAAEALFCTPRRHARPLSECAVLAEARAFEVRLGRKRIACWRWGEGPSILLAHGWEGRGSQLFRFVAPLVEAGHSVVTWDAPAHGDSAGKRATLIEFTDTVWAVGRGEEEVHGVIGHSMGCAALGKAFSEGLPVGRAVFISAPASLADYSVQFASTVGISEAVRARMLESLEDRYQVCIADMDVEGWRVPADVSLLLIHDEEDREVSLESSRRIERIWPGARLVCTQGLGHRRILKESAVLQLATEFLCE